MQWICLSLGGDEIEFPLPSLPSLKHRTSFANRKLTKIRNLRKCPTNEGIKKDSSPAIAQDPHLTANVSGSVFYSHDFLSFAAAVAPTTIR